MSAVDRYVVLGLASVRSAWFREVGRWATAASVPMDYVKCLSTEEVRARLSSGREFSAVLVDSTVSGLDRDLVDSIAASGAAVIVVSTDKTGRNWVELGAAAVLAENFHRADLVEALHRHARPLHSRGGRLESGGQNDRGPIDSSGRLVAVLGGAGAGVSTVAMSLAQGLGADPRYSDVTLLADLALNADLAMLHDARDVVPGLQEMVDAHRAGSPGAAEIRSMVYEAGDRGYHLLLGLRRHRDWVVLRPSSVAATLDGLGRAYRLVVADIESDLEGADETGAIDIEERNQLARSVVRRADICLVVGTATLKGLHDLVRVVTDLVSFDIEPERIVPVLNRSGRPGRARAELTRALAELLAPISSEVPSALHLPEKRRLDDSFRNSTHLPVVLAKPLSDAVLGALERVGPAAPETRAPEPVAVTPGSLGTFTEADAEPREGTR